MSEGETLWHTLEKSLTLTHGFIKTRQLYWCLRVTCVGNKVAAIADYCEDHTKHTNTRNCVEKMGGILVWNLAVHFYSNPSRFVYYNWNTYAVYRHTRHFSAMFRFTRAITGQFYYERLKVKKKNRSTFTTRISKTKKNLHRKTRSCL